jgi:hypothetical protein
VIGLELALTVWSVGWRGGRITFDVDVLISMVLLVLFRDSV